MEIYDLEVCADCVQGIEYGEGTDHEWSGILPAWSEFVVVNGRHCPEPFHAGTIIHGTMRHEDLIPALVEECKRVGVDVGHDWLDFDDDTGPEIVAEIIDELDRQAPDGFYYGAHIGDGSDLGLWPIEDDHDEFRSRHTCDCCGATYSGSVYYASAWKR